MFPDLLIQHGEIRLPFTHLLPLFFILGMLVDSVRMIPRTLLQRNTDWQSNNHKKLCYWMRWRSVEMESSHSCRWCWICSKCTYSLCHYLCRFCRCSLRLFGFEFLIWKVSVLFLSINLRFKLRINAESNKNKLKDILCTAAGVITILTLTCWLHLAFRTNAEYLWFNSMLIAASWLVFIIYYQY